MNTERKFGSIKGEERASGGQCPKETAISSEEEGSGRSGTVRFTASGAHKVVCSACKEIVQRKAQRKQGQ